ncbi:MAG: cyclic nucleotide-binding domain-containing protein [Verrucomicrobiota bacterium]
MDYLVEISQSPKFMGEVLLNISMLIIVVSYAFRDILWLRTFAIFSSAVWIVAMNVNHGFYSPSGLAWHLGFMGINIYQISALIHENRSAKFTDEERDLYQTIFQNFQPGEFMRLLATAQWHDAEPGRVLLEEGQPGTGVKLITGGRVDVEIDGQKVAELGEGTFVGEMSYLSGEAASADVKVTAPMRYLEWNNEKLTKTLERNPTLKFAFHSLLTTDLTKKLLKPKGAEKTGK